MINDNDLQAPKFKRSSFCDGGDCAEIAADAVPRMVRIRNSGYPLIEITFSYEEWGRFLAKVKSG